MSKVRAPLISVVTPYYNSAAFLAGCIESVLNQSVSDFEYLLVNNKSTDTSPEIAAGYAASDPRIRLIDNEIFVGQVENYNGAFSHVDPASKYVKLVQADDALFPDCLRLMVDVARSNDRIGLVGSFYLKGDQLFGAGIPLSVSHLSGRDVCRMMLLGKCFPVGSPTTVLYRADVVRARRPFYALGHHHEDTEAAYEILLEHDFGFVHQVLSFLRADNESIMSKTREFNPLLLDHLIVIERYGRQVLTETEFDALSTREWRSYWGFLGKSLLKRKGPAFWDYHRRGLSTIGRTLNQRDLLVQAPLALAIDPLAFVLSGLQTLRARRVGRP